MEGLFCTRAQNREEVWEKISGPQQNSEEDRGEDGEEEEAEEEAAVDGRDDTEELRLVRLRFTGPVSSAAAAGASDTAMAVAVWC